MANTNIVTWKNEGYGIWKDSTGRFVLKERITQAGKTYALFDENDGYSFEADNMEDCTKYAAEKLLA